MGCPQTSSAVLQNSPGAAQVPHLTGDQQRGGQRASCEETTGPRSARDPPAPAPGSLGPRGRPRTPSYSHALPYLPDPFHMPWLAEPDLQGRRRPSRREGSGSRAQGQLMGRVFWSPCSLVLPGGLGAGALTPPHPLASRSEAGSRCTAGRGQGSGRCCERALGVARHLLPQPAGGRKPSPPGRGYSPSGARVRADRGLRRTRKRRLRQRRVGPEDPQPLPQTRAGSTRSSRDEPRGHES